jgi:helix-turn-helix, Psq domain
MAASSLSPHAIPLDILSQPQDEWIKLAVAAIRESGTKPNGDPNYSARQAAQDFDIPRSSLGFHLRGMYYLARWFHVTEHVLGGKTCHKAHVDEQTLTEAQEEILAKWIKIQGCRGVSMTYASVGQCAKAISGRHIGGSWPKWFCKRHPNLKMKKTTRLEKARAKALNQFAVNEFFDMLTEVIKEYNILPKNLYNMDEKGIQLGIGARITAMIDRDQKMVYSIEDENRELVTVIETIYADGSVLHPSVIFQGQRWNSEWGWNNPCNARFVSFQFYST